MLRYLTMLLIGFALMHAAAPVHAATQNCWGVGSDYGGIDPVSGAVSTNHDLKCNYIGDISNPGSSGNPGSLGGGTGPDGGGSAQSSNNTAPAADKKNSKNPCPTTTGDPVDLASGNKIEAATDFALPGEMGLKFARYYNSQNSRGGVTQGGWSDSLDYEMLARCVSTVSSSCSAATFVRPDGSRILFSQAATAANGASLIGPFTEVGGGGLAKLAYTSNGAGQPGTYTLIDEDSNVYTWSENTGNGAGNLNNGILTSIKDVSGIGWTITHPSSAVTVVTHTSGQQMTLTSAMTSTANGNVLTLTVTDPAGNNYIYQSIPQTTTTYYLLPAALGTVTFPGPNPTVITYKYTKLSLGHNVISEVDYNGIPHDVTTYDSNYRAAMTSMADGSQKVSMVYSSNSTGPVATVTNELGKVAVYQYDANDLLISISGQASAHCAASFANTTYDANGNMQSATDNNGNITNYTYAATGQLQQKVEAVGTPYQRTTNIVWDPTPGTDRMSSITVVGLQKTVYAYSAQNRLASTTVTNLTGIGNANQSLQTTYGYVLYASGMVQTETVTFPSGNKLTYAYDALGNLSTVTNALGQATTYSNYTALGRPGKVTNANGDATNYGYDARNRVISVSHTHAGSNSTGSFTYDPNSGQISDQVAFDGEHIHNTYDVDFKLSASTWTGPSGATITQSYAYDAMGNVTSTVRTLQGSATPAVSQGWSYDELGRVITTSGNHGQQITTAYDLNGNVLKVTDAAGHSTSYQYDALNRPLSSTDANNGVTSYQHGLADRINQVTDSRGLITSYSYDGLGQLWTMASPDTGTTHYAYDSSGRLASLTRNNGGVTSYAYDALDRPTSITAGGETHTFTYDNCTNGKGLLCADGTPNTSTSYTYTPEGWVAQKTVNSILGANVESYAYDGLGRMVQIAGDSMTVGYSWTDDQVSQVNATIGGVAQTVANNITYDASRNVTGWTYGNGMQRSQTYDSDGRITGLASGVSGNMQQNLGFSYDDVNRVTGLANAAYTVASQNFGYDALDRLTSMTGPAPMTLTYDANGNRTQQNWLANETVAVDPASNRIANRGSHLYTYDANGNRATHTWTNSTLTYSYDGFNRLRSASRNVAVSYCETTHVCPTYPAGTMTYFVDAEGRRESKTNPNGETAWYGYLPSGQLSYELSATRGYNRYIYLGGQPIGVVHSPQGSSVRTLYYIHSDQMGRPDIITDGAQNKVWQAINFAFDRSILIENISGIDIGFPGQIFDQETGNWNNGFRDYDSSDGRYLESDPIGLNGGINTYAYAGNNPLSFTDAYGLQLNGVVPLTGLRGPDYVTFELDAYVFSFSATYTVYGDVFVAPGTVRQYKNPLSRGVSISGGWLLNGCEGVTPSREELNNYLEGYSASAGGYLGVGGSFSANSSGKAVNVGFGAGKAVFGVSPGSYNVYQGNIFMDPR